MSDGGSLREPLNRPITDHEKALIRWLLDHGEDGIDRFISQIDTLTVASECTCGCPTIDFVREENGLKQGTARPIIDYMAIVDGQHGGVMLFATETQLSMLEIYSLAGTDKPFGLPKISDLFPWEQLREDPIPSR
jgi:hypothetical protein